MCLSLWIEVGLDRVSAAGSSNVQPFRLFLQQIYRQCDGVSILLDLSIGILFP